MTKEWMLREIERLRSERDDARRKVCKAESSGRIGRFGTAQEYAQSMGWDCFKDDAIEELRARLVKELYAGEG